MIRFDCPLCGMVLEVAEDAAGRPVACTQCGELCAVPARGPAEAARPPAEPAPGLVAGLLSGMSRRTLWGVALLAAAAVLGLPLALLHPLAGVAAACSFVLLCAVLLGHATRCPSCRKWWARERVGREFIDREVFDRGGATCARARWRTTYACGECRHRWHEDESEEFRAETAGSRRRQGAHTGRGR